MKKLALLTFIAALGVLFSGCPDDKAKQEAPATEAQAPEANAEAPATEATPAEAPATETKAEEAK